jgi:hypothetical protein
MPTLNERIGDVVKRKRQRRQFTVHVGPRPRTRPPDPDHTRFSQCPRRSRV